MFTPVESLVGALLIQFSVTSYMLLQGQVIGFSNLIYNMAFAPSIHSTSIVLGIYLSTQFIARYMMQMLPVFALIKAQDSANPWLTSGTMENYVLSGGLVGFGTCLGCGCTSGHFIAGLSRLRWRSFMAVGCFVLSGVAVVSVLNNGITCAGGNLPCYAYDPGFHVVKYNKDVLLPLLGVAFVHSYLWLPVVSKLVKRVGNPWLTKAQQFYVGVSSGFLFGCGLMVSGMTDYYKVLGFLSMLRLEKFDPSLMIIAVFVIIPNYFIWKKFIPQSKLECSVKKPVLAESYQLNFSDRTPLKFIIGNLIFGLGWGLAGICPGPGLIGACLSSKIDSMVYWIFSYLSCYAIAKKLFK
ncbi:unnamed protein product [Ambrosiozyma monospora]|uniref:Unnamed protein product n=1 Tax=Ambrosiozyma monospora TaxID=43982 RepID=A0ACB5SRS0_AMBMO|nr:unnamed protein product [Ambrosiozyma monospora]